MSRLKTLSLKILLTGAIFLGATTPSLAEGGVGTYFKDRGNDILDILRFRAGAPYEGKAFGLKARATALAQLGYVDWEGKYAGINRRGIGIIDERRREGGVSLAYISFNEMEPVAGNKYLMGNNEWTENRDRRIIRNEPHWDDGRQRHLSFGAELATPLFGIDVGVYPEEALDLVLGILTIDILRDDELRQKPASKYLTATTLPVPQEDAPFQDVKAEHEEFLTNYVLEQSEVETPQADMQDDQPVTSGASGESIDTITPDAADEAMRELESTSLAPEETVAPTEPAANESAAREEPVSEASPRAEAEEKAEEKQAAPAKKKAEAPSPEEKESSKTNQKGDASEEKAEREAEKEKASSQPEGS